jgi:hypothetical protein
MNSLYVLEKSPQMCIYFPGLIVAYLLILFFHRAEVYNFNEVQLINYFFHEHTFGAASKKLIAKSTGL